MMVVITAVAIQIRVKRRKARWVPRRVQPNPIYRGRMNQLRSMEKWTSAEAFARRRGAARSAVRARWAG
jgi:hypothetical protein